MAATGLSPAKKLRAMAKAFGSFLTEPGAFPPGRITWIREGLRELG
jgi:hypothetical protein